MSVPLALPNKNTRRHFKQFLTDYMAKINPKYGEPDIQEKIYAIRCSLVHVFGDSDATEELQFSPQFYLDRIHNDNHLTEIQNENYEQKFCVSISKFIGEIVAGVTEFFRQNDTPLQNLIPEWGKKMYWLGGSGIMNLVFSVNGNTIVYKNIHPLL